MGRTLIEAISADEDFRLTGALEAPGCVQLGQDAGAALGITTGVKLSADPDVALAHAQVLIDFTSPAATLRHLALCSHRGIAMVIGTTGIDSGGRAAITTASARCAIVYSPNMSVGVNVMLHLVSVAAARLDSQFDVEISETHHRHKRDAPSGTALAMGAAVAAARGVRLPEAGVFERHGETGERPVGAIGFSAQRGGDIIGDHTVLFAGAGERIEITHRSSSRMNYANGSLRAARFVADRRDGLYDMQDVLGMRAP